MFSIFCDQHGARVLLDMSRVWRLEGADGQYHLHWVCWCGADGVLTVPAPGASRGGPPNGPDGPDEAGGKPELIETS